jgi:hypothetical protein
MKELMKRSVALIRDTHHWLGVMAAALAGSVSTSGSRCGRC